MKTPTAAQTHAAALSLPSNLAEKGLAVFKHARSLLSSASRISRDAVREMKPVAFPAMFAGPEAHKASVAAKSHQTNARIAAVAEKRAQDAKDVAAAKLILTRARLAEHNAASLTKSGAPAPRPVAPAAIAAVAREVGKDRIVAAYYSATMARVDAQVAEAAMDTFINAAAMDEVAIAEASAADTRATMRASIARRTAKLTGTMAAHLDTEQLLTETPASTERSTGSKLAEGKAVGIILTAEVKAAMLGGDDKGKGGRSI